MEYSAFGYNLNKLLFSNVQKCNSRIGEKKLQRNQTLIPQYKVNPEQFCQEKNSNEVVVSGFDLYF